MATTHFDLQYSQFCYCSKVPVSMSVDIVSEVQVSYPRAHEVFLLESVRQLV